MSYNQTFNGRCHETRQVVSAGETRDFNFAVLGDTHIAVHALGDGVSAVVSASISPSKLIEAGQGLFVPLSAFGPGGVVANSSAISAGSAPLNALRVQAIGGDVIVEVLQ